MVGVGDSSYVIPLDIVLECVEIPGVNKRDSARRNYIDLRGEFLPCVRLREFFGVSEEETSDYEHVVVVRYAGNKTGLVVDKLYGEMQTVIKSLGSVYKNIEGVSGATILGDGTVSLILDVPRVMLSVTQDSG
jgi:two-component system chemotaxis sensor kinase CheA